MKRWPCVLMAISSTGSVRASLMISVEGSPMASTELTWKSFRLQLLLEGREVSPVLFHLFAFAQIKLLEIARRPAIGDMHQHEPGVCQPGQRTDVLEDRFVGLTIFHRNEDGLIHGDCF